MARLRAAPRLDGARLLEVPDGANGARPARGRAASRTPGPGLSEAPRAATPPEIRDGLVDGDLEAVFLVNADPVRDLPGGPRWSEALGKAEFVVAVSMFEDASTKHADVVFPAEIYAEKEGTVTHPDGRLQRLRPAVPHPGHGPARDGRCWSSSPRRSATRRASTRRPRRWKRSPPRSPSTPGITHEEIGGARHPLAGARRGREQLPELGAVRAARVRPRARRISRSDGDARPWRQLRLGTYRDLWAAEVTDRSPALRFLAPQADPGAGAG